MPLRPRTLLVVLACALAANSFAASALAMAGSPASRDANAGAGEEAPPARPRSLEPDPAEIERPSDAPASTQASVRVVLLDVGGTDLDAREATVVRNLIEIRLEKNAAIEVVGPPKQYESCTSTECIEQAATGKRADFAVLAQTATLGDALIFTLAVYDVAHAHLLRDAISVRERGDLPDKIAALVDQTVTMLLARLPPVRRPDVRTRFEQARLEVCTDPRGWFFCDQERRPVTENEFVRRYRSETGHHDLDVAEIDRDPNLEPWIFMIGGGATALATVGVVVAIGTTDQGQQFARESEDAWIVVPVIGLSAALALVVYGAIELDDAPHVHDGSELDHVITAEAARDAVRVYDDAVLARLQHEAQPG